ncbi:MAG: tetratricopeptide repeat protein [Desulfobacterales bacterium]|nr:MAG: tetratricopeptide repeat protein [Desulfobacterales bacterium]
MGRKPARPRKHFFLYLTCLLSLPLSIASCQHVDNLTREGANQLALASIYRGRGDYRTALREYRKVLDRFPEMYGHQALYQMGLLSANPQNPDSDLQVALNFFEKLIKDYPDRSETYEAEVWVLFLRKLEATTAANDHLSHSLEVARASLHEQQKQIGAHVAQIEIQDKQIEALHRQIDGLNKKTKNLKNQIELLKHIDIGIEEKKRRAAPQ